MLNYIPSWIVGAKTLLEKLNKCIEKIEETRHVIKDGVVRAGDNISINDGVISATDTKYTPGDGIEISEENEINVVGKESYLYRHAITISRTNQNLRGEYNRIRLLFLSNTSTPLTQITQMFNFNAIHGISIFFSGDILVHATEDALYIASRKTIEERVELIVTEYLYSEYEIESDDVIRW